MMFIFSPLIRVGVSFIKSMLFTDIAKAMYFIVGICILAYLYIISLPPSKRKKFTFLILLNYTPSNFEKYMNIVQTYAEKDSRLIVFAHSSSKNQESVERIINRRIVSKYKTFIDEGKLRVIMCSNQERSDVIMEILNDDGYDGFSAMILCDSIVQMPLSYKILGEFAHFENSVMLLYSQDRFLRKLLMIPIELIRLILFTISSLIRELKQILIPR